MNKIQIIGILIISCSYFGYNINASQPKQQAFAELSDEELLKEAQKSQKRYFHVRRKADFRLDAYAQCWEENLPQLAMSAHEFDGKDKQIRNATKFSCFPLWEAWVQKNEKAERQQSLFIEERAEGMRRYRSKFDALVAKKGSVVTVDSNTGYMYLHGITDPGLQKYFSEMNDLKDIEKNYDDSVILVEQQKLIDIPIEELQDLQRKQQKKVNFSYAQRDMMLDINNNCIKKCRKKDKDRLFCREKCFPSREIFNWMNAKYLTEDRRIKAIEKEMQERATGK